jgi:hypothetical protein
MRSRGLIALRVVWPCLCHHHVRVEGAEETWFCLSLTTISLNSPTDFVSCVFLASFQYLPLSFSDRFRFTDIIHRLLVRLFYISVFTHGHESCSRMSFTLLFFHTFAKCLGSYPSVVRSHNASKLTRTRSAGIPESQSTQVLSGLPRRMHSRPPPRHDKYSVK